MHHLKGRLSHQSCLFSQILIAFCFLMLLLTTGCISNRAADPQPTHLDLAQFKTASVEVKSDVPKPLNDQGQYELRLANQIITALRKDQVFERVYPASDAPSELQIIVTITHIRDVNMFHRELVGALAGPAQAEATLEFREGATGKLMGSCRFDKHAYFNQNPFTTTADTADLLADAILQVIHRNL
jgi:hypothetical protein